MMQTQQRQQQRPLSAAQQGKAGAVVRQPSASLAARLIARGVSRRPLRALASTMATLALSEREVVALELAADAAGIHFQVRASTPEGLAHLTSQLQALYPQTRMVPLAPQD